MTFEVATFPLIPKKSSLHMVFILTFKFYTKLGRIGILLVSVGLYGLILGQIGTLLSLEGGHFFQIFKTVVLVGLVHLVIQ